jgi:hypothetical protein
MAVVLWYNMHGIKDSAPTHIASIEARISMRCAPMVNERKGQSEATEENRRFFEALPAKKQLKK